MRGLLQDVRYAIRVLSQRKAFTIVAVLTLALGIGANTTIFSVVDAIVFRPLPVRDPANLVAVYNDVKTDFGNEEPLSYLDYADFRDQNQVFSGIVAYILDPTVLGRGDQAEVATGEFVTGNYFDVLGVRPRYGATFHAEDDQPQAAPVAVISYATWKRRFGGDPNIIGQKIDFSKTPFTVIGVAEENFTGLIKGFSPEFWIPIRQQQILYGSDRFELGDRRNRQLFVTARLKSGVTIEQARTNMAATARRLAEIYPESNKDRGVTLIPASEVVVLLPAANRAIHGAFIVLMTLSGLVLLIACANLANLLLARASGRRREIAVRLALGGSRKRVIRQLLTESVVLALMGGAAGLLVAVWCNGFLNVIQLPLPIQIALGARLDWRVLTFTFAVSVLAGIIFGLVPALQASNSDLVPALKDESGLVKGRYRIALMRNGLVAGQVAISLVLLIFAGLTARSLWNASSIDPGFNPANVGVAVVDPSVRGYDNIRGRNFSREFLARARALPGVASASMVGNLPLTFSMRGIAYSLEGRENLPEKEWQYADGTLVAGDYFKTMSIALLDGRDFSAQDEEAATPVVIVNETMAKRFWPNQSAIGRRINVQLGATPGLKPAQVIGVVKDGKYRTLGEQPRPFIYGNVFQNFWGGQLVFRAEKDLRQVFAGIRSTVTDIDPNMPVFGLQTLVDRMGVVLLLPRYASMLFGAFGLLGALLAVVGLYGVVSYSVSQRTREIGIRIALGGTTGDVLKLVVHEGMIMTGVGLGLGLLLSAVLGRFISIILYGIGSADPLTFSAVSILMIAVTLAACLIPARRASRVDPMTALRYE